MENIIKFIRRNYAGMAIGLFFYLLYLHFTISGNRICDCESTEEYRASSSGSRVGVNRFYHK